MTHDTALTTLDPLSKPMGFRFVSLDELTAEQKQVLKDTVAQQTTDTELTYFLNVALAQELDPFRKEVWCIKRAKKQPDGSYDYTNAKLIIMTGRDGFLKMAKRDPSFDYIQSAEVREGDHFVFDPVSGHVEHRFGAKRGTIVGAYAVITRKDKTRIGKYVTWAEYHDSYSDVWKDYPTAMICKVAEAVLCKQFANVSGIVAEETISREGNVIDNSPVVQGQQSSLKDDLIARIQACKSPKEFAALRDTIAVGVGKLFGAEREAVFAAAKAKKAELEAVDISPVEPGKPAVETPPPTADPQQTSDLPPESHSDATGMPEADFDSWLEGMKAQETLDGIDDVYNQALTKPMSPIQRGLLDTARESCRKQLEEPKAKKKAA